MEQGRRCAFHIGVFLRLNASEPASSQHIPDQGEISGIEFYSVRNGRHVVLLCWGKGLLDPQWQRPCDELLSHLMSYYAVLVTSSSNVWDAGSHYMAPRNACMEYRAEFDNRAQLYTDTVARG